MKQTLIVSLFLSAVLSQGLSDYTFNTAQSSSLAGAVVSNRGGSWSLYNNPATLAELEKNRFSIGHSKLYSQDYLPLSSIGIIISKFKINFGFKYSSLSVNNNNIELLDEDLFGIVTGINLLKDKNSSLAIGISANYHMIHFGSSAGVSGDGSDGINSEMISAIGADIGFLGSLRQKNRIGVFIKNINSPIIGKGMSIQNLPRKIHIGLTTIPNDAMEVSFTMEQLLGYHDAQYRTALQYQINQYLSLNTGIQINPNRFGCGFNVEKNNFTISYGYLTHHVLPGTHQFNFGMHY